MQITRSSGDCMQPSPRRTEPLYYVVGSSGNVGVRRSQHAELHTPTMLHAAPRRAPPGFANIASCVHQKLNLDLITSLLYQKRIRVAIAMLHSIMLRLEFLANVVTHWTTTTPPMPPPSLIRGKKLNLLSNRGSLP